LRSTAFGRILAAAVVQTPRGVSFSLAAEDGETVDSVLCLPGDPGEVALLTAHYAIIMRQVRAALGVFHYGGVSELMIMNHDLAVLVEAVGDGYLAILTVAPGAPLGAAQRALGRAAEQLRGEIA
jgi:predicted regulator of Ras-like GTPase activity (Roadblock/LC7/MglB family)